MKIVRRKQENLNCHTLFTIFEMRKIRYNLPYTVRKIIYGNVSRADFFAIQQNICDNAFFRDDVITHTILLVKGQLNGNRLANCGLSFFTITLQNSAKSGKKLGF